MQYPLFCQLQATAWGTLLATALPLHCHCTATALPLHCHCTATALPLHCHCTATCCQKPPPHAFCSAHARPISTRVDLTAAGPVGPSPSHTSLKPINPFEEAARADPPGGFSRASGGVCVPGSIFVEQAEGPLRPSASFDHLAQQKPQASFSGASLQPTLSANPTRREQRQWQNQARFKCCRLIQCCSCCLAYPSAACAVCTLCNGGLNVCHASSYVTCCPLAWPSAARCSVCTDACVLCLQGRVQPAKGSGLMSMSSLGSIKSVLAKKLSSHSSAAEAPPRLFDLTEKTGKPRSTLPLMTQHGALVGPLCTTDTQHVHAWGARRTAASHPAQRTSSGSTCTSKSLRHIILRI